MAIRLRGPDDRPSVRRRLRRRRVARTVIVVAVLFAAVLVIVTRGLGTRSPSHSGAATGTTATADQTSSGAQPATTVTQQVRVVVAASLPAPRSRPAIVTDGGSLLILGGLVGGTPGTSTSSVLRFDPAADAVAPAGNLAVVTHDAAAASTAGGTLVFGGGEATTIDT